MKKLKGNLFQRDTYSRKKGEEKIVFLIESGFEKLKIKLDEDEEIHLGSNEGWKKLLKIICASQLLYASVIGEFSQRDYADSYFIKALPKLNVMNKIMAFAESIGSIYSF